ncbi:bifunctional [glutamate--ammonia ligase]-adenylyl-L-tyrosine phosphorylase/[glutamate--ammonia-ligase] adenylyltransferase [Methylomarinum vadi]|uniref:bifunctional [glutamate--ammonia ligase]-adenylyl-L-tyrosine phosphorylase/[glutamate--ammonia-ligase] adenylyltransferase n=1 Tax=Methylomarinum vadi TaxID=438855 RepID=UPI00068F28A1|nr:bifunctional [glutamate--ammonia ligase]-adenylyl-L-tyrosine phosphorylase/[glutamate--ammonia-ligase] adenylyltransferase [Methylomarinum vadi]
MSSTINPGGLIESLPDALQAIVAPFFADLNERLAQRQPLLSDERVRRSIARVACCSEFVRESCLRNPQILCDLVESGDLFSAQCRGNYSKAIEPETIDNDADLMKQLRQFRRREMVRIAWRDLAGWADLDETMQDLTALAEACIQTSLDYLYRQGCERRGTPVSQDGTPINIVVLGMGKLGAWELNYSSDIDLIFAYAEDGVLHDRKETSYGEFFTRICRSLVKMLDETTPDGFVFRTDARLRPFGDSGPLIMTFEGMEQYYMTQAREWERYAMIKARQVAGDFVSGKQLMAMIKPFVYRRYLDYGAFEELRSLKLQITQELRRKDRMENIKLGPGGIREIEFIGQAFQLIRGGHEPELQQREIQKILLILENLGLMTKEDAETLRNSYVFLRRVENHIQQYQDRQTHDLPTDPLVRQILAYSLDFADWDGFKRELDRVRKDVHHIFEQVFSLSEQEESLQNSHLIWAAGIDREQILEYLGEYGFLHCAQVFEALQNFKHSHAFKRLTSKGAGVMDRLLPQLIETVRIVENQDETLLRILTLFEAVAGRTVYLSLLAENPDALAQLVKLSSASVWISDYLAQYPVLFDELLDPQTLYEPLQRAALAEQLELELQKVNVQDDEQLMFLLRQFKHQNVLRVAAADIMNVIPLMVVSDYLTYIAEAILEQVVERAWKMLTDKHGFPPETDHSAKKFAIIGMGKLGGIELGYGSDLDMVFIYDCADGMAMTDGPKPIGCTQFYMRLGQKVRHILDTKMLSGVLYEVDLRLRPSGDSGLLVTHINSYEHYLKSDAWTWEHQALVRGRFIAGDPALKQQYEAIRRRILALPRAIEELRKEVREMREKMRENLAPKDEDIFDLKQSKGGIADIEFIVQFGVLAHTSENEALATYTDNVRLLEGLAEHGFISKENAALLKKAYCAYRDYGHRQVLQGKRAQAGSEKFLELRAQVRNIWHDLME